MKSDLININQKISLKDKKILLGITASIATYKVPIIVRELQKQGAEVKIVATPASLNFVSELVLNNLTHSNIISDMFASNLQNIGAWHIDLAHWCDLMLIVPATATTLSKLATGNADNPVSCLALALPKNKPLMIAPAMDFTMYENVATQSNILILQQRGAKFIEPESGELASGLIGKGRLADSNFIISEIISELNQNQELKGKKILITAGGTEEKIDDVRYISNYSSGKMGYAIAEIAIKLGAEVTLISARTYLPKPLVHNFIQIYSAEEMFNSVKENYINQEIIIMAAAVSDYTPINYFQGKLKKDEKDLIIKFKKTEDILSWIVKNRNKNNKIIVGFALEANNDIKLATKKLKSKNCDILVFNYLNSSDFVFGNDYNTITILDKNGEIYNYETKLKTDCAKKLLNIIENRLQNIN